MHEQDRAVLDIEELPSGYAIFGTSQLQLVVTVVIDDREIWTRYFPLEHADGIFESFGGNHCLQLVLDNKCLALYGPAIRGLIVMDLLTGETAFRHYSDTNYVICVTESASSLWLAGTQDGRTGYVSLLGENEKEEFTAVVDAPATRISPIGPSSRDTCWFMSGVGESGTNRVFVWNGASKPTEVLQNVAFRHLPFPTIEQEWAAFCGLDDGVLYVISAEGTILEQRALPIPETDSISPIIMGIGNGMMILGTSQSGFERYNRIIAIPMPLVPSH